MEGIFKRHILATKRGIYKDTKILNSNCLFCELIKIIPEKLPSVQKAENGIFYIIKSYENHILVVNPFPYSPRGHLEIISKRHIEKFHELTKEEFSELQKIINSSLEALEKTYNAENFNIGVNLGKLAGASYSHFHMHIVPRFESEAGFLESTSSTRVIAEDPKVTMEKVAENIK